MTIVNFIETHTHSLYLIVSLSSGNLFHTNSTESSLTVNNVWPWAISLLSECQGVALRNNNFESEKYRLCWIYQLIDCGELFWSESLEYVNISIYFEFELKGQSCDTM